MGDTQTRLDISNLNRADSLFLLALLGSAQMPATEPPGPGVDRTVNVLRSKVRRVSVTDRALRDGTRGSLAAPPEPEPFTPACSEGLGSPLCSPPDPASLAVQAVSFGLFFFLFPEPQKRSDVKPTLCTRPSHFQNFPNVEKLKNTPDTHIHWQREIRRWFHPGAAVSPSELTKKKQRQANKQTNQDKQTLLHASKRPKKSAACVTV